MKQYVYSFKEGNKDMRVILGGKGANLAEMTSIGLPVPQGFTVSTEACTAYYEDGKQISPEICAQIDNKLAELEVEEAMKPLVETIQVLSPMAEKYNIFIDNEGLTDVNSLAKNLAIKNLGRNNFYKYLRSKGLLQKDNCPYQRYVNDELFVLKPAGSYIVGEDTIQNYKTYITTKGVNKIIDMLIKDQYLVS